MVRNQAGMPEALAMITGIVTLFTRDEMAGDTGQSTTAAQRATAAFLAAAAHDGQLDSPSSRQRG